jgi:hypothetical protein
LLRDPRGSQLVSEKKPQEEVRVGKRSKEYYKIQHWRGT